MIPKSGDPLNPTFEALTEGVTGDGKTISVKALKGHEIAMLTGIPRNVRITFQVKPEADSSYFGICVRGSGSYEDGCELRFEPSNKRVQIGRPHNDALESPNAIEFVEGLDHPFNLDVIVKDDIIDVCIDQRRTIITRRKKLYGDRLFFFVQNGSVTFDAIEVRPLNK